MTSTQDLYQNAIRFAAEKHKGQTVKESELPYVVHLSNVSMEIMMMTLQDEKSAFDLSFAVQVALLHDTIEDTDTSFEEIKEYFGPEIAEAVMALTKNEALPTEQRMPDTISRVKKLRKEVWAVKLADRITNLQMPPDSWSPEKRRAYLADAHMIYEELHEGNAILAERLRIKMEEYKKFL
jgi:guanosine-3',5'-bis(diphosphate) 3'-pyrophosphohydrolase